MSVTPTKGDGEERWSSGSRWDGGAEGETSAMDGLGWYCPSGGCDTVVKWRVRLRNRVGCRRKSKFQGCLRKTARTERRAYLASLASLVRVPKQRPGRGRARIVCPPPLLPMCPLPPTTRTTPLYSYLSYYKEITTPKEEIDFSGYENSSSLGIQSPADQH